MNGWETTVKTGNPQADQSTVEGYRQHFAQQGLRLDVTPLPGGGYHVRAVHAGAAQPQQGYGQAAQPQAYGQPLAQHNAYGQAQPQQNPYGQPHAQHNAYGQAQPQQNPYGQQQPQQNPYGQPQQAAYGQAPAQQGFGGPQMAYAGGGAAAQVGASAIPALSNERVVYLRKVYGLLTASAVLAIVCGFICISVGKTYPFRTDDGHLVQVPQVVAAMLDNPGLMYGAFALLFGATVAASWVSKMPGINTAALFFVAALMGVELAPMVFVAQVFAGFGQTLSATPVRDAFSLVAAVFFGITAYVFVTRKDFSYLRAILSMGFFVVFFACILTFVLGSEPFSLAVATVGALLAAGFLLYETSYIFRNSEMDDPVGDALALMVQLRNLFMFILRIAMSRR